MRYFAYGSNLSISFMWEYCPSTRFVMKADLPNYQVEFRHYSEEFKGGISSIIETPGELVRGVIYEIEDAEIEAMDILESIPEGLYRRETFLVLGEDGDWHKADLYRVVVPDGPFIPAKQYVDYMITGAREHKLDPTYVEHFIKLRESLG